MPPERNERLEREVIELWRSGTRRVVDIAAKVGRKHSVISKRISRMIAEKRWPFEDRPSKGGPRERAGRKIAVAAPPVTASRASRSSTSRTPAPPAPADLAGLWGQLNIRVRADLYQRLRHYCARSGVSIAGLVTKLLEDELSRRGA